MQIPDEKPMRIKVKTLNLNSYDILVFPSRPISSFLQQIEQKTKVPAQLQRLTFKGLLLSFERSLQDYKLEEGNTINLIANRIPCEVNPHITQENRGSSHTREQHRYKKHRYLQQRPNGFKLNRQFSIEVLQQNKRTIDQLLSCLNFNLTDLCPFKMERKLLCVGEWVDVRDASGQWVEGQVIGEKDIYVQVHFNQFPNEFDQWLEMKSDRLMPFRTYTVQTEKSRFLSPSPNYHRSLQNSKNAFFQSKMEGFIPELTCTIESVNILMKELYFGEQTGNESKENKSDLQSIKVVKNSEALEKMVINSAENLPGRENLPAREHLNSQEQINVNELSEALNPKQYSQQSELDRKQEFETPSKEVHLGDNLSNKCEDDISNNCDNDDISNKSYKSKRSEGVAESSYKVDRKPRQNKVFFDNTEEAQSVRSIKNSKYSMNRYTIEQEYILEEVDSQQNEDHAASKRRQLKRKMKASQLAPLVDRLGRLLIDLAPHFAMLGHLDQPVMNENLSTCTNEGSLESKMDPLRVRFNQEEDPHTNSPIYPKSQSSNRVGSFCQFQIPVMLTPWQLYNLNQILERERRQI